MRAVYTLNYERNKQTNPELNIKKLIGIYSTYDKALEGLIANKDKLEFAHYPVGLSICKVKLNHGEWSQGIYYKRK